mgnify:CR=1 FL=1|jgi:hypothetical protein
MEKFIDYVRIQKYDVDILYRDLDRLYRITNTEDFGDLIAELSNFTVVTEKILDKYTLITTLGIMDTIKLIFYFYKCDNYFMYRFNDEYNNLLDLKENRDMYARFSYIEVRKQVEQDLDYYLRNNCCFTEFRQFLILALFFFEFPLRLSNWIKFKLEFDDYENLAEYDDYPFYIVVQKGEPYFIFNKYIAGAFKGQHITKIKNKKVHKLMVKYIINLSVNKQHFLTNKSGKPITATNLSNGITNFTRDYFGKSISLNNLRVQFQTYKNIVETPDDIKIKDKLFTM